MTRVNFEVSQELDETLERLVQETSSASKSEVLRRAIALMSVASQAKQKGEKVIIADSNRVPLAEVLI